MSGPSIALVIIIPLAVEPLAFIESLKYIAHVMTLTFMAGLLILVGMSMIKFTEIRTLLFSDKKESRLFMVALFITLLGGLSYGFVFGLILSIVRYIRFVRSF